MASVKTHDSHKLTTKVTSYFQDVNGKDLVALEGLCDKDVIYSDRVWADHDLKGLPKLGKQLKQFLEAYPDYVAHLDTVLARDDSCTVAAHWTAKMTCKADYHGIPATGKRSVVSGERMKLFR